MAVMARKVSFHVTWAAPVMFAPIVVPAQIVAEAVFRVFCKRGCDDGSIVSMVGARVAETAVAMMVTMMIMMITRWMMSTLHSEDIESFLLLLSCLFSLLFYFCVIGQSYGRNMEERGRSCGLIQKLNSKAFCVTQKA